MMRRNNNERFQASVIASLIFLGKHSLLLVHGRVLSKPFITKSYVSSTNIPDVTSQFLQPETAKTLIISPPDKLYHSNKVSNDPKEQDNRCPYSFNIGVHSNNVYQDENNLSGYRNSGGIHKPPLIAPTNINEDAGHKEIWYTTNYEHLDKLTTTTNSYTDNSRSNIPFEEHSESDNNDFFPLLFESSSFQHTSPIYYDINADGKEDIILIESSKDGRIFLINGDAGSSVATADGSFNKILLGRSKTRSSDQIQIPSLKMLVDWYNHTTEGESAMYNHLTNDDEYLAFFSWDHEGDSGKQKGVPADILHQDVNMRDKRKAVVDERFESLQRISEKMRKLGIDKEKKDIDDEEMERIASLLVLESALLNNTQDSDIQEHTNDRVASIVALEAMLENKMHQEDDNKPTEDIASMLMIESQLLQEQQENDSKLHNNDRLAFENQMNHDDEKMTEQLASLTLDESKLLDEEHDKEDEHENGEIWDDVPSGEEHYTYDDILGLPGEMMDDYLGYYNYRDHSDTNKYVTVDPHVLASPTIVELTKPYSVKEEPFMVIPVSYHFDEREYSYRDENHEDPNLDSIEKRRHYAASAILIYDIGTDTWWVERLLDISTRENNSIDSEGAYIQTSPTIVDLDNDKTKEIIVGTSMGFIYVLDTMTLKPKKGFPLQMSSPIHSQIMAADVMQDSKLELIAVDTKGNIVCLNHVGDILWSKSLGSDVISAGGIAIGDVDGDGNLDIVCITNNKGMNNDKPNFFTSVFALNAQTGEVLKFFPIIIPTTLHTMQKAPQPPLLIDLHSSQSDWLSRLRNTTTIDPKSVLELNAKAADKVSLSAAPHGGKGKGIHIVTPTPDGYIYITEGGTGCTNRMEVGEGILATPLAEDLHDNGRMGLVLATSRTGEVVTLESPVNYHKLNSYNGGGSGNLDIGTRVHGYGSKQGILLSDYSSQFRHVMGFELPLTFEIFDIRENIPTNATYSVEIRVGSHPDGKVFTKKYNSAGTYTERVRIPKKPQYYTIFVQLTDENGVRYEQYVKIGYNINVYRGLEWLVALPLFIAAIPLLLFSGKKQFYDGTKGRGILDGAHGSLR